MINTLKALEEQFNIKITFSVEETPLDTGALPSLNLSISLTYSLTAV